MNDQRFGRYDQDFRFGSEDYKSAFHLVRLLESRGYKGPLHSDAHAYRTEDEAGGWEFASGCMRTYKILQEKAEQFDSDPEVTDLLDRINGQNPDYEKHLGKHSRKKAVALKRARFNIGEMGEQGLGYERLDQLLTEVLLGVRSG